MGGASSSQCLGLPSCEMRFEPLKLAGAFVVHREGLVDERGSFARSFCAREFAQHGLSPHVVQCNVSVNRERGTLRGMHFQRAPHAEAKLITCLSGAVYDVIVDIRTGSPTFHQWLAIELRDDGRSLYVPEGFAHGFQTLEDATVLHYQMSEYYDDACAGGLRFDDPRLGIAWPLTPRNVSPRDRAFPLV